MLDPKILRNDLKGIAEKLKKRGFILDERLFEELESKRKALQTETQGLQNERNEKSKNIGKLKASGSDVKDLLSEVEGINDKLKEANNSLKHILNSLNDYALSIPNIPHDSVPHGENEKFNREEKKWGQKQEFEFEPKDHVDIGNNLEGLSFDKGVKIAGSRFVVMYKDIARLHRALAQFMLDVHTNEHGYDEVYVPYLANRESLIGTGQLPKFSDDLFQVKDTDFFLIPTAEVPLSNLIREQMIEENQLPLKLVAHTPCFRSEAGAYGKDTRGMIRQHQFEKIELVQVTKADYSFDALEILTSHAEAILQKLNLPYRVVTLCDGDLGFSATKTYDLEVWLPGQNRYREISSCSNFLDFQARRMQARWRNKTTKKTEFLHTLNGSGLAVGRTLVALLENNQLKDGSVVVPSVLVPYMGGKELIQTR
tara:strand:+ start:51 stop:1328 length:1278 start_codon:yes stop_codon:yes gene_type:complete